MREILVEQQSDGSWMAACRAPLGAPLGAIIRESDTGWAAELACGNEFSRQQSQVIAKLEKDNE